MRVIFIGMPNVGKSSILNLIVADYKSRVSNIAGTTTDWREVKTKFGWIAIDTPGIIKAELPDWWNYFNNDLCIFVGDASRPLCTVEKFLLRKLGNQNTILCLNKSDKGRVQLKDFIYLSVISRSGLRNLIDTINERVSKIDTIREAQCMFIGKPNSGKSSLINALIGYERLKVSEIEGTTSDIVYVNAGNIQVLDTPGEHRKGIKMVEERISKFCGVIFLVLDSTESLVSQNFRCINAAFNNGCPIVILLNKFDLAPREIDKLWLEQMKKVIPNLIIIRTSAITKLGMPSIVTISRRLIKNLNIRIPTSTLNTWIKTLNIAKIKYISQVSANPIKLHFNHEDIRDNFVKFICNKFRKDFDIGPIPILVGKKFY